MHAFDSRYGVDSLTMPSLICDFCPSDQRFAYNFLQIPPHDGHPCCSAIHFPLSGHVRDLHPLERAHGAQTKRENTAFLPHLLFLDYSKLFCCTSESTISYTCNIIIKSNSVFNENPLHESCSLRHFCRLIFICIICQFGKNMPFII